MAIIESARSNVHVRAQGDAMRATVNFSGALMEMLATTYSYPALAAVRESIQNACDAAGRAGKTFCSGVFVRLPTLSDPTFMVRDEGAGMSREFMEGTYLSLGSSTKAGDDAAAGGMGIGRFAAYGFARECTISTTDEHDMVERTYFQYMGEDGLPRIQFAGEAPGTVCGTKITFPVKMTNASDVKRAVAWLSEIMQLTMGDTLTLKKPGARAADMLPEHHSRFVLDLGGVDETLSGVRIFPFSGDNLCFANGVSLAPGSLIVQTNQERHVGGLPFHVHSSQWGSIFNRGCIIEVPLSMGIPFMPSREEVKYNDDFKALCERIDRAALKAMLKQLEALIAVKQWDALADTAKFLTSSGPFGYLCHLAPTVKGGVSAAPAWEQDFAKRSSVIVDGIFPGGHRELPLAVADAARASVLLSQSGARVRKLTKEGALSALVPAPSYGNFLELGKDGRLSPSYVAFNRKVVLVCQDVVKGGEQRLRSWLKAGALSTGARPQIYVVNGAEPEDAQKLTELIKTAYQTSWEVIHVSDMPEVAPVKAGTSGSKRAARAADEESLQYYDMSARTSCRASLMQREIARFDGLSATPKLYFCRGKQGGIEGLSVDLRELFQQLPSGAFQSLSSAAFGPERKSMTERLYVLTPAQRERLETARSAALEADPESEESQALSSWVSVASAVLSVAKSGVWPEVLAGKKHVARMNNAFTKLAAAVLCEKPRLSLMGTALSRDLLPFFDVANGDLSFERLPNFGVAAGSFSSPSPEVNLLRVLQVLASLAKVDGSSPEGEGGARVASESAQVMEVLLPLRDQPCLGVLDVDVAYRELESKYPLLSVARSVPDEARDDFCLALARVYQ